MFQYANPFAALSPLNVTSMAIDAVQDTKVTWVKTFIKDEKVSDPLIQFVDSQRAFVKQIAKSGWEISGAVAESIVQNVFKK